MIYALDRGGICIDTYLKFTKSTYVGLEYVC
jgi:hypothetical protein